MRFEMAVSLRSRVRISDGGEPTAELLEFGRLGTPEIAPGAFGKSVKSFACTLLRELGCPIQVWMRGTVRRESKRRKGRGSVCRGSERGRWRDERMGARAPGAGVRGDAARQGDRRVRAVKAVVKREMLERVGMEEVARIVGAPDAAHAREELRGAVEAVVNTRCPSGMSEPERERVAREVLDDVVGLGPLQGLLDDESVSEIMVNGYGSVFYERGGVLHSVPGVFESEEQVRIIIDRIISPLGRRVDERSPIVNARCRAGTASTP